MQTLPNLEITFQRQALLKLKFELIHKTENLNMSDERKSYFLHQLNNVHAPADLVSLLESIDESGLLRQS